MNAYLLLLIIPVSIGVGFVLAMFYVGYQIKKMMGIKSWKKFARQIKQQQELQKKMAKGDMNSMLEEINKDPHLKKQMEELRKRFDGFK